MSKSEKFSFQTVVLPTKSMQEVVTSIAAKITHLIISSSSEPEKAEDSPDCNSSYQSLVTCAADIVVALKNLVEVSNKTVCANYGDDEIITEEVDVASQNLLVAGENMHLCCQVLASTQGDISASTSSVYDVDLTACLCKTFQNLVVLLLCLDSAEVRHLVTLSSHVHEQLHSLASASSMEHLVETFNKFATALDAFHSRASQRCGDILSTSKRGRMWRALTTLTHSMPMLTTALSLAIKYPNNEEALSAKKFASHQIEKTMNEIMAVIKARPDGNEMANEIGLLVSLLHSIERTLDAENRENLVSLELESMVQSLVQQLMTLSTFTSDRFPRFSKKETHLVRECQKLLELTSLVVRLAPVHNNQSQLDSSGDSSEFGSVCRAARGKLKSLHHCTFSLITSLFSHIFTIKSEPFDDLLKLHKISQRDSQLRFQSALSTFQSHCDDVARISNVISSCCSNPDIYRDFHPCNSNFSSITQQIIALCSNDSADLHSDDDDDMLTAFEEEWKDALQSVLRCCVLSLDLSQLVNEIEADVSSECEKCHEDVVNLDDTGLSGHVISASGKAKLLVEVANHVVSASTDPMFRNNVLAHNKLLKEAICHVIASSNLVIEDTAKLSSQEAFMTALSQLKSKVAQLSCALLAKPTLTDLSCEDRKGLRDASDSTKISNMIQEMQKLNQKLSNLGFEANLPAMKSDNKLPAHLSSLEKSHSQKLDDMFGTSGPEIELQESLEEEFDGDVVGFGSGMHALASRLIDACTHHIRDTDALQTALSEIGKMSDCIFEICDDSHSSITTCKKRIFDVSTKPTYTTDKNHKTHSMAETIEYWKNSLSESRNLIEGMVTPENGMLDVVVLTSFCEEWSKAYRILLGCFLSVLQLHLISFRRFLTISEFSQPQDHNLSDAESDGLSRSVFSSIPSGSLLEMGRMSQTLCVLLCDVIVLYRRDVSVEDNEKKSSLLTRLDVLLSRSKQVSADVKYLKKVLKQSCSSGSKSLDSCWLHIYSFLCAAKLSSLYSLVDTTLQLVLGVWKVNIPELGMMMGGVECGKDYKSKLRTLSQTAQNKIENSMANCSLEPQTLLKLTKMRHRVDVSCTSIADVSAFVSKLSSVDEVFKQHGHLLYHMVYLHHRLLLDVARTFLFTKALLSIADAESKTAKYDQSFEALIVKEKSESGIDSPPKSRSYSERLAALTTERKAREEELLYLLTDIDAERSQDKTNEGNYHSYRNPTPT